MIRSHALKVEDDELLRLLEHDVQFFEDDLDDGIEEMKEAYEKKLLQQEISFQKMIKDKDFSITVLKGNIADLEEAAEQLKERRMTDKIGPLQSKLEKAEKMIEEMEGELQSSQEENRRFRSEHNTLLVQVDNLKDVLQQKLAELESQAVELTTAVAQRQHLLEQVEQLQSELVSCRTQLASERRRVEEEKKKREMQEMQLARAKQERAARLVRQSLKDQAQSVLPDDRLERAQRELSELKEEFTKKEELLKEVQLEVSQLRTTAEAAEAAQKAQELHQAELKSNAAAAEAEVNQRFLELQKQLETSRAQENQLAQRLQGSQDRLGEAQAQVEQLRRDLEQLQSQLEKEQTEKAQTQAEGKVDAEDLRKALEKLEAERAVGEKADKAKTHERHEPPKAVEKQLPSLSENFGSQEAREATSFFSDEKLLTDQSQQTDPGEQLEDPQSNPLEQELALLRGDKAQLQQTIKALQEELRLATETDGQGGQGGQGGQPQAAASRHASRTRSSQLAARESPCEFHSDEPKDLKDEIAGMFDYPRVLTMGGGWLSGVSKKHKVKQLLGATQPASPSPRGRSPDFEKHMPAELVATRMPSPSPCRSSSPSPMVPRTAKAKRSTVCRSPPRHECAECDSGRQQRTARAPVTQPAVVQGPPVQEWDKAGHPLGVDCGWSEPPNNATDGDASKANLANIDMATAAQIHQRVDSKSGTLAPRRAGRDAETLRRTFSGHSSISETVPTSRAFPRPRSAALLPGFRGRGNVRRLRPCSATGL